ncbi:MAG: hypothetical protein MUF14_02170 [Hyphomonadaceae bacterium]|jgi:hypothetical protein|nr:hypothetical protein [Hyphomonadaceae bacterium]
MGILFLLSGLVIAAYAGFSGIAWWLAARLHGTDGAAMASQMEQDGVPAHHLDMLVNFSTGWRLHAWAASVAGMLLAVIALVLGQPSAVYWFGGALIIDCLLFMTCPDRKRLLERISPTEQVVDVAQTLALLAAFMVLAWREIVNLA